MYKLLIAEDEPIIRDGIIHSIEWEKLGFQVVGAAEDGQEALDMIRNLTPDVLVTDIKMPGLTGLELMHILEEEKRKTETIIITGYAQFKYAKEAIEMHAFGYVLKIDLLTALPPLLEELYKKLSVRRQNTEETEEEALKRKTKELVEPILQNLKGDPLTRAVQYIAENFAEQISMEKMAGECFMNSAYFSRTFKNKTGKNFSEMIIWLRMECARYLLENSRHRIMEIAEISGYHDIKQFNSQFKKAFHKNPSEYRELKKGDSF